MELKPGTTANELMAWGFRVIVGVGVLIGLPLAGAMLNRVLHTADQIAAQVQEHNTKLEVIGDRITGVRETLQDHEQRLRVIEQRRGP